RGEPELRQAIIEALRTHGIAVSESVPCAAGAADLVTRSGDAIFEVKHRLNRRALYQAVGQVLLYRLCINPDARAIVVGYAIDEIASLLPLLPALGIEIVLWRDKQEGLRTDARTERKEMRIEDDPFSPQSFVLNPGQSSLILRWNVAALA